MGYLDLKVECGICERTIGLNRYKVKKSNDWICPACLKEAGGLLAVDVFNTTIEEIKGILIDKHDRFKTNPMSTAEGMYKYCIENNFGSGYNKKWSIKHFHVIERNLTKDEQVFMTFLGLNGDRKKGTDGNYAFALTNKRLLIGQKKVTGENFKVVYHERINDISLETGFLNGNLIIDTPQEKVNVSLEKDSAAAINTKIHEVLHQLRHYINPRHLQTPNNTITSTADELKKFKDLLDMGAITQEEYDTKKKQLLDLL